MEQSGYIVWFQERQVYKDYLSFFFTWRKAMPTSVISLTFFLCMTSIYPLHLLLLHLVTLSDTHTLGRTARPRDTLHEQDTDRQATGGTRTRNYRKRDVAVLRLRLRGH